MIVDFTVANFGPFSKPVTLSFEATNDDHLISSYVRKIALEKDKSINLLRMALLFGANAAGKSSILDALSLLDSLVTQGKSDVEDKLEVNTFAFQAPNNSQPTELTIKFVRAGVIFRYQLTVTENGILCETLEKQRTPPNGTAYDPIYQRCRGDVSSSFIITYGVGHALNVAEQEKLHTELLPNTTMLFTLNRKMSIQDSLIKDAYGWFASQLLGEVTPHTNLTRWITNQLNQGIVHTDVLVPLMNQAGIPIVDIKVVEHELTEFEKNLLDEIPDDEKPAIIKAFSKNKDIHTVYKVNGRIYQLDLEEQESLGTQRYYQLAGLLGHLCSSNPEQNNVSCRILPIDEIEHSLHPDLLEHFLITFLKDKGDSQLIATTHYRELLMDRLLYRNDVIWFVDKNKTSLSSNLYCLEDVAPIAGLRSTSSVYNFYKQHRLGGVPNIED